MSSWLLSTVFCTVFLSLCTTLVVGQVLVPKFDRATETSLSISWSKMSDVAVELRFILQITSDTDWVDFDLSRSSDKDALLSFASVQRYSYSFVNLEPSTSYLVRFVSTNRTTVILHPSSEVMTTLAKTDSPPTPLVVSETPASITLKWTAVAHDCCDLIVEYVLDRVASGRLPNIDNYTPIQGAVIFSDVIPQDSNQYTLHGLESAGYYCYRLTKFDKQTATQKTSSWSCSSTQPDVVTSNHVKLQVESIYSTSITFMRDSTNPVGSFIEFTTRDSFDDFSILKTDTDFFRMLTDDDGEQSVSILNLTPDTTYLFRVTDAFPSHIVEGEVKQVTTTPRSPTNLSSTPLLAFVKVFSIDLQWSRLDFTEGKLYLLEGTDIGDFKVVTMQFSLQDTAANGYAVVGLEPSHTYKFRISQLLSNGQVLMSEESSPMTTLDRFSLLVPRLRMTMALDTSVTFKWEATSVEATHLALQYTSRSDFDSFDSTVNTSTDFYIQLSTDSYNGLSITDLVPATSYRFRLYGLDAAKKIAKAGPELAVDTVPSSDQKLPLVVVLSKAATSVTVSWTTVGSMREKYLECTDAPYFDGEIGDSVVGAQVNWHYSKVLLPLSISKYTMHGLRPSTTYRFRLVTSDGVGGPSSLPVHTLNGLQTSDVLPTLRVPLIFDTCARLLWDPIDIAGMYVKLEYTSTGSFEMFDPHNNRATDVGILLASRNAGGVSVVNLKPQTTYAFRLVGSNGEFPIKGPQLKFTTSTPAFDSPPPVLLDYVTPFSAVLKWSTIQNVDHYVLQATSTLSFETALSDETHFSIMLPDQAHDGYSVLGLAASSTYRFRLVKDMGSPAQKTSPESFAMTTAPNESESIPAVTCSGVSDTSIHLTWDATIIEETKLELHASAAGNFDHFQPGSETDSVFKLAPQDREGISIVNLLPQTVYAFRLSGLDWVHVLHQSNLKLTNATVEPEYVYGPVLIVTTLVEQNALPELLLESTTHNSITLKWSSFQPPAGVRVSLQGTTASSFDTNEAIIAEKRLEFFEIPFSEQLPSSYMISDLRSATSYQFRLSSRRPNLLVVNGPPSVSMTTQPVPVLPPTPVSVGPGSTIDECEPFCLKLWADNTPACVDACEYGENTNDSDFFAMGGCKATAGFEIADAKLYSVACNHGRSKRNQPAVVEEEAPIPVTLIVLLVICIVCFLTGAILWVYKAPSNQTISGLRGEEPHLASVHLNTYEPPSMAPSLQSNKQQSSKSSKR